jgi:hypothetical protein
METTPLTALEICGPAQFLIDVIMIICFLMGAGFFLRGISEFLGACRLARMKAACILLFPIAQARAAFELFRLLENPGFQRAATDLPQARSRAAVIVGSGSEE